jgi:type I restriction enzyme S subunit
MPDKADLREVGYPVFSGYRVVGASTKYHYEQPEIIVVARGVGGTGDVKMSPPFCFLTNLSIAVLVEDSGVDKAFLYHRLAGTKLWDLRTGSAQAQITIERLRTYEVELPPLPMQRRIASVLGAYNDLIEVNRRRIEVLEEMARRLFEEWFVHFRYPGHETHLIGEAAEGPIPEGWRMLALSEVATAVGDSISPSESPDQQFLHFSFPAYDDKQLPVEEAGNAILSNKLRFTAPAVLIGKLNPRIPRIWYVPDDGLLTQLSSTEFVPVRPRKPMTLSVLYAFLNSSLFAGKLRSLSQGTSTSHQRARPRDILAVRLPVPPAHVINEADRHLAPLYKLALELRQASVLLAKSRDLLVPRLLSGELPISVVERELENAA